jgi:uncharacterized membrane protein SpoIIM required for sporulation
MLRRSAGIYLAGFLFGVVSSAVLLVVYPSLNQALFEFLRQKVTAQSRVIQNPALMIIANNIIASAIASFGGVGISNIVNLIYPATARKKAFLYTLPVVILFVNGEGLGLLLVLYRERLPLYLSGIFPHGFFEIPAIILSGSIGLEISEASQKPGGDFQRNLNKLFKAKLPKFSLVLIFIIIGGFLEGSAL